MGHNIRAIIGTHKSIQKLTNDWVRAKEIELLQGYGMVFLTDGLLDDIAEVLEISDDFCCSELDYFTKTAVQLLEIYSFHTKLAYIETDYFGGIGTQGGVLYKNGQICRKPHSGDGTINLLLRELGVWCAPTKDEFDSLNVGIYREMPE